MTTVLGIEVSASLVDRWRGWFAPAVQPFRSDLLDPELASRLPPQTVTAIPEWVDTFFVYSGDWIWLAEDDFGALTPSEQRSLMAARRRSVRPKTPPVWPGELAASGDHLLFDWVASGAVRPSRHGQVGPETWAAARATLPGAEQLAGTFAHGSGPNCFGTVMAAAGLDAANRQVKPAEFQTWLDEHTEPVVGTALDDEPGVVFVWIEHGQLAHATVTVGGGWMLTKPSQSWSSPRLIYGVREAVHSWRYPQTKLSRHRLSVPVD